MDSSKRLLAFLALSLCFLCTASTSYGQIFTSITPVYYHTDLVGSPVAETDANGDLLWKADRFPYGQEFEPEPTSLNETIGYAGHVYDRDTELVYMQARYYDPYVGRFYGVDPQGVNAGSPDTFNLYAYSSNNPFANRDPNGEWVETAWDVINVGIGVASFTDNYAQGNYLAATLDAVGVVFDTAAVIVPGLPAGASYTIKASRAADKALDTGTAVAKGGGKGADFIVSPKGTTMPTNKDFNLVDSNKKGGDWFQIHNKHTDAKVDGSPHTHYPKQHGGSRTREIKRTDGGDLDQADSALRNGSMRERRNRGDKGG